jgi:hypothetical protein
MENCQPTNFFLILLASLALTCTGQGQDKQQATKLEVSEYVTISLYSNKLIIETKNSIK